MFPQLWREKQWKGLSIPESGFNFDSQKWANANRLCTSLKAKGWGPVVETLCITESTMGLHYWNYSNSVKAMRHKMLFKKVYPILWPFSDGWWLLRVIWSESDTARVRSSPPGYNKTWERRPTMERSWWRTFASNWPPPSRLGPPVRRGPSPRVTPRSISTSQSGE